MQLQLSASERPVGGRGSYKTTPQRKRKRRAPSAGKTNRTKLSTKDRHIDVPATLRGNRVI